MIKLRSVALTAEINQLGAELSSLCDIDGRELLTDADPAFWRGRAPLLFPIVGALVHDQYRIQGKSYDLAKHGLARKRHFDLVTSSADKAAFRLASDAETRAVYPFDFQLDMAFALNDATLAMTATISNTGEHDMLFSFGFHPAFAWPLPFGGAVEDHRIIFATEEPAPIRRLAGTSGLIDPEPRPTPVEGRVLSPSYTLFEEDALIWDRLNSRSLRWGVPGQPHLKIDFPDTPLLGIWQKPGARFLCIEPWAGIADPLGFDGEFAEKPGVMTLPSGMAQQFRMDVTLIQG